MRRRPALRSRTCVGEVRTSTQKISEYVDANDERNSYTQDAFGRGIALRSRRPIVIIKSELIQETASFLERKRDQERCEAVQMHSKGGFNYTDVSKTALPKEDPLRTKERIHETVCPE